MSLVRLEEVARWYGEVLGLHPTTLVLGPGITGLVGPNGAGKSTLLKLLTGQIRPSVGTVSVFGEKPFANARVLRRIGYCPSEDNLVESVSARRFLHHVMRLHGFAAGEAKDRAQRALERVSLGDVGDRSPRTFSKGMRQRWKLAQAIGHDPELLVLDEPLNGLDPVVRQEITEFLRSLAANGTAIVVSSHILHELEGLCQQVVMVHRGRVISQGTVQEVGSHLRHQVRRVKIVASAARVLGTKLLESDHVTQVSLEGDDTAVVHTRDLGRLFDEFPALVTALSPGVLRLESPDTRLESVFDDLVTGGEL